MEVDVDFLAGCLGLTSRRIRELAKQGMVVKIRRGAYDLEKSIQAYVDFRVNSLEASAEHKSLEAVKAEHEQLKMRKTELSVRLMEGKLHRAEDVERVMTQCAATVKSRMLAIPVKVSPEIAGIEDPAKIQKILQREVADALNEVAEYDPADYADPTPMEDEDEEGTGEEN